MKNFYVMFIGLLFLSPKLLSTDFSDSDTLKVAECAKIIFDERQRDSDLRIEAPSIPVFIDGEYRSESTSQLNLANIEAEIKSTTDSILALRTHAQPYALELNALQKLMNIFPETADAESTLILTNMILDSGGRFELFDGYNAYYTNTLLQNPTKVGVRIVINRVRRELVPMRIRDTALQRHKITLENLAESLRNQISRPSIAELMVALATRRDARDPIFSELPSNDTTLQAILDQLGF